MIYKGKYKIIDNFVTACDYDFVLRELDKAIKNKKSLLISPIASHTLVKAHYDNHLKQTLDRFDYLVPDSQWARWSIPFLYGEDKNLDDRVYGPELMLKACSFLSKKNYRVFLYGNTKKVLEKLKKILVTSFPKLQIAGEEESRFRELTNKEWVKLRKKISSSKTQVVFISLGSPKQEIFGYKLLKKSNKPLIIIPVGAAFDFVSKNKPQAPKLIQQFGFEWLFRLVNEPARLLTRYLIYGTLFAVLVILQRFKKLRSKIF